ncbi:hypothetical protein F5972_00840 [Microbispora cellulosiformans]|uniref:Transposase DDE domain-containing protein n=1 Tax=Microbispora cellulosiformans TaxID=2614688 RepID=A0A5J5K929_9ACTN|nr:transposase [Microbispora cellulosiformans]KAA9381426.1 hypothetical protein F5972_00840 [Microbispora cellulosiformans]
MIGPFTAEAVLADGYAAGLLVTAAGLDRLARHVARRSERHRTGGFTYRPGHDAWVCPAGQMLWPVGREGGQDPHRRLYRAKPSICNACPRKADCTSSHAGREIVRELRPWPHSEAGRFHRGLALVLVVLAASLTLIQAVRHPAWPDLALVAATLVATALTGWRLTGHLRATPDGFPEPEQKGTNRDRYTKVWRSES